MCLLQVVVHVSENIDCGVGCLTYSQEEICQASSSDHNVYAVCKVSLKFKTKFLFMLKNYVTTLLMPEALENKTNIILLTMYFTFVILVKVLIYFECLGILKP